MQTTKPALGSKTIIGSLIMLAMFALNLFGLDNLISENELGETLSRTVEAVNAVIFVVGFLTTVYGRYRAFREIRGVVKAPQSRYYGSLAIVSILSLALLTNGCASKLDTAIGASAEIAAVAAENRDLSRDLFLAGKISEDGATQIASYIADLESYATEANSLARDYRQFLQSMPPDNADAKAESERRRDAIAFVVIRAVDAADNLLTQGTLHIRDPNDQLAIRLVIRALRPALRRLQSTFGSNASSLNLPQPTVEKLARLHAA